MTSPRKFAEKIALHNQKQAEETAAFDQIMKEVSNVSRQPSPHSHIGHKSHHLQLAPTLGAYRGGSLPNVNQLGNNSIDLQNALHSLEDIKAATTRSPVGDRVYRSHQRSGSGHRSRHDTAPYQTPYLSPPSDTSWRRTNSDSALHTSVMAPIDPFQSHGSMSPGSHRREMVLDHSGNTLKNPMWDAKKQMQSRPRSCEVPGISICMSSDQTETESSSEPIPISNNTGSLPDLTNLHIPSPLPTPLDPEDQQVTSFNHGGGSPTNLSSSMPSPTHLSMAPTNHTQVVGSPHSPQISPQVSPQMQRRHMSNPGSPLGIHAPNEQQRRQHQQQHQQQHRQHQQQQQHLQQQQQQQQQAQQVQQQQQQQAQQVQQQQQQQQQQQHFIQQGISLDHQTHHQQQQQLGKYSQQMYQQGQAQAQQPQATPTLTLDMNKAGLQYREGKVVVSTSCTSPTSPVSNPQYSPSPAHSPSATAPQASPTNKALTDAYYQQLQHQFEQCSMLPQDAGSPTPGQQLTYNPQDLYCQGLTNHQLSEAEQALFFPPGAFYGQAYMQDLTGSQELLQPNKPPPAYPQSLFMQPTHSPNAGNIPDIILTGTGESPPRQDFAKEISNAMAGVDNFDPLFSTDGFKLDPLDLDSLQMLTDNDMVADQATEDSFRLDRLDRL
ncbi:CREB-regulated transcription coactivator 1-like isoform X2 [Asterias rubens]|uniref:CREB-regulated transcription coactivator 1-like isoform X2 n=1 Tax=Asterias rubens TaxID=7604 RepID=UPI0014554DCE|nr:CREB-regulated transcription coactivator 1-like isoform X2 [Asterias rubens]